MTGGAQALSAFSGKKVLVVVLPGVQGLAADSMLYSLDTLAENHSSILRVIAVPAYEDGFTINQKEVLKQWYRSKLDSNRVIIADGLYTRKTSENLQHSLFKWLTKTTENEVFDSDVQGPGQLFFVNGAGQLFGVLPPQSKIWGASVQRALNTQ